jgi:ribosomal protein S7
MIFKQQLKSPFCQLYWDNTNVLVQYSTCNHHRNTKKADTTYVFRLLNLILRVAHKQWTMWLYKKRLRTYKFQFRKNPLTLQLQIHKLVPLPTLRSNEKRSRTKQLSVNSNSNSRLLIVYANLLSRKQFIEKGGHMLPGATVCGRIVC